MNETRQLNSLPDTGLDRKRSCRERPAPQATAQLLPFCLDEKHRSMVREGYVDHLPSKVNCSCLKRPGKHPQGLLPFLAIGQFDRQQPGKQTQVAACPVVPSSFALSSSGSPFLPERPVYKYPSSLPPSPISSFLSIFPKPLFSPPSLTHLSQHPSIFLSQHTGINISFHFSSSFIKLLIH